MLDSWAANETGLSTGTLVLLQGPLLLQQKDGAGGGGSWLRGGGAAWGLSLLLLHGSYPAG